MVKVNQVVLLVITHHQDLVAVVAVERSRKGVFQEILVVLLEPGKVMLVELTITLTHMLLLVVVVPVLAMVVMVQLLEDMVVMVACWSTGSSNIPKSSILPKRTRWWIRILLVQDQILLAISRWWWWSWI